MNNEVNNNENLMNNGESIGQVQTKTNLETPSSETNSTPEVATSVNNGETTLNNETPKINDAIENVSVEDNILGEKKKSKLPFIIIGILLLILLCFVGYKFLYKKDKELTPKEVFSYSLDKISDYAVGAINGSENIFASTFKQTHKINANLNTKAVDMAEVSTILKKLEITLNTENDNNAKYLGANFKINYDNAEALDAKVMLHDKYLYLNLGSLYDKNIRYEIEGIEQLTEIEDNSTVYVEILNEIIATIKNELKETYFSYSNEKLNNEDVTKYTLTINSMNEYINNIIKSLKANDQFVNSFKKLNITTEDLNTMLDNLLLTDENEDAKLIINVYLTKNNELLKINLIVNDKEVISIIKDDGYAINILINEKLERIGSFKKEKDYTELNINYDGVVMNVTIDKREKINKNNFQFKVVCKEENEDCSNGELKITTTGDSNSGTVTLYGNIPSLDIELTINDEYELLKDAPVNLPDFNNYIDLEKFQETEAETIERNLLNNSGLLSLLSDLGLMSQNETTELLKTSCTTSNNGKINYTEIVDKYRVECHDGICQAIDTMTNAIIDTITCGA